MRPWIIVNGPENMSEDTAYLIGRIAPHADTMHITSINRHGGRLPDPPGPVDVMFVRLREATREILSQCEAAARRLGIPMTNRAEPYLRSRDKRQLPVVFPDLVPETYTVGGEDALREAYERLGGDVVVKDPFGNHGKQVRRVSSHDDMSVALDLMAASSVGEIVVMPFMSGFKERDRRILVVPDEHGEHRAIAAFTRRPAPGAWICNLSSGGSTVFEEALPEEEAFAAMAARRSGLDTAQLDIGWHDGRIYLIEINSSGGGYIDNDIGHRDNCADHVARFLKRLAAEGRRPETAAQS